MASSGLTKGELAMLFIMATDLNDVNLPIDAGMQTTWRARAHEWCHAAGAHYTDPVFGPPPPVRADLDRAGGETGAE